MGAEVGPVLFLKYGNNFKGKEISLFYGFL